MTVLSIDEAKTVALEATSGHLSHDQAIERLESFKGYLSRAIRDEDKVAWQEQISALENWLASEKYKSGDFPRGIDELLLELIEWRAMKYAFQHTETERSPFKEYVFYSQWLVGGTYAVFSLLGKLTSRDGRDNSLRNLWDKIQSFIDLDGACSKDEINHMNHCLDKATGHFTNTNSKALRFRNTVIAHNEKSPTIAWDEIDKDIQILVRMWSIIVSWCSFGIFSPFRSGDQALDGLDSFFNAGEIARLKARRQEYIDRVISWSVTHLHSGLRDPDRGAFAKLSITSTVASHGKRIAGK